MEPEVAATDLEKKISAAADLVIEAGKTGYNWSDVDDRLSSRLGP